MTLSMTLPMNLTTPIVLSWIALATAALPLAMTLINLAFFRRLPPLSHSADPPKDTPTTNEAPPSISVLIPARNEERSIGSAIESVLTSTDIDLELIVLDDESTDDTAVIVRALADKDSRVRLIPGGDLPTGWTGKQFACHTLSRAASNNILVWMDADVRLEPTALARMAKQLTRNDTALLSGFPRQEARTWMEKLVVPLIHLILLGYLPMPMMRWTKHPGFGAGCGQLFLASRKAYEEVGGHGAIRSSMHDGLTLPRAFRDKGFHTDIFDGSDIAVCRMYQTPAEVWWGFGKNAHEAMASPAGLPVWTLLLLAGHVLPWFLAAAALVSLHSAPQLKWAPLALASWALAMTFSILIAWRFRQPWLACIARPIGVSILVMIQWFAFIRRVMGLPMTWKQRAHPVTLPSRPA